MKAILVRVGADTTAAGGKWNGFVDTRTNAFVYIAIPEGQPVRHGMERSFQLLANSLAAFGQTIPNALQTRHMHLDPDFEHLTYGDVGERANQLRRLGAGDLIVFYAGLRDIRQADRARLVYAIIGLLVVKDIVQAVNIGDAQHDKNAHTRRLLPTHAADIVVRGDPSASGRVMQCIPIGSYRDRAYRVHQNILTAWGGLSVRDGYLQRSARLPRFLEPTRFLNWIQQYNITLLKTNNP